MVEAGSMHGAHVVACPGGGLYIVLSLPATGVREDRIFLESTHSHSPFIVQATAKRSDYHILHGD